MKYRRHLAIILCLLILGVSVAVFRPSKPQLIARGKPVSEWALALAGPAPTGPAQEVIRSLGPEAVPDLVRLLQTKDSLFAEPLRALVPKLPNRIEPRFQRLFRINETVRRRHTAAMALGLMGTNAAPAIPALLEALRDPSISVSATAGMDLARIGPATLPGLVTALDDPSASTRRAAMIGLAQLGPAAGDAVPRLIALLQQPTDRAHALATLQAIGKPAVAALLDLLQRTSDERHAEVIEILGKIGVPARSAIPALIHLAKDRSSVIRFQAITSLGNICPSCDPVSLVLQNALDDESERVRSAAAAHLSTEPRAAEQTVNRLLRQIEEGAPSEKQRAISNLGRIGAAAERAVPQLTALTEADNHKERELARVALEQIIAATQKREIRRY